MAPNRPAEPGPYSADFWFLPVSEDFCHMEAATATGVSLRYREALSDPWKARGQVPIRLKQWALQQEYLVSQI